MKTIALKFGGTSLADANQIRKVAAIINQSQHRRYVVVSAPGKTCFTAHIMPLPKGKISNRRWN